jgi:hypothetical protein
LQEKSVCFGGLEINSESHARNRNLPLENMPRDFDQKVSSKKAEREGLRLFKISMEDERKEMTYSDSKVVSFRMTSHSLSLTSSLALILRQMVVLLS